MNEPSMAPGENRGQPLRREPRWPPALAILVVFVVLVKLPGRARLFPYWMAYAIVFGMLLPMVGIWLSGARAWWLRLERVTTLSFSFIAEIITLATLKHLVLGMVNQPETLQGTQLLSSSTGAWLTNVLAFSLVYWQIDRGGPESRCNDAGGKHDWLFPREETSGKTMIDRRPVYVDYLFLAFTTATAFSPTDTLPLSPRAKVLMMVESAVSLVTLAVVAARAINILGR